MSVEFEGRRRAQLENRPRPLLSAAATVTQVQGIASAVLTALVGWGIVSAVQGDALQGLLGALPGLVTMIGNVLIAFGVVRRAESQVTPLVDPRNDAGERLRPAA